MSGGGQRDVLDEVRERLDRLGYREPLPPASLPLVQHLLTDLVAATGELQESKALIDELKKRCEDGESSVAPYKEENGRLLTQLNQLHMDNLHLRELTEKQEKELQNAVEKAEEECRGLRLLVGEYQRREEELRAESSKKSDRILHLHHRNLKATVNTPGGGKHPVPLQRQRLEITSHLPANNMSSVYKCSKCGREEQRPPTSNNNNDAVSRSNNNNNDVYLADLLRMTDQKLLELQQEVEASRRQTKMSQDQCGTLKKQIENRESEITRLQGLLEGGRRAGVVSEDNRVLAAHTHIHHLQLHNDLLTKTNLQLEGKLKHILGDTHDAMNRAVELADVNTDLTTELHHTQLNAQSTQHTLTHRLNHTRSKLLQCEGDLSEQHRMYHLVKDERDRLYNDLVRVRHDYTRLSHHHTRLITERGPMEEELRLGQEEKKTLIDKINRLTVSLQEAEADKLRLSMNGDALRKSLTEHKAEKEALNRRIILLGEEKDALNQRIIVLGEEKDMLNRRIVQLAEEKEALNLRIAQLQEEKEAAEQGKAFYSAEVEKLTGQGRELEQERDYYKEEMIKEQTQIGALEQERDFFKDQSGELSREKQVMEDSRAHLGDDLNRLQTELKQMQQERSYFSEQLNQTQGEKRQAEREREYYSEQVVQLLDLLKTKPSSTPSTPMQVSRARSKTVSPETELARVLYERDVLRQERDFYKTQYQSLRNQQGAGSGGSLASGSGSGAGIGVPVTGVGVGQPPPPQPAAAPPGAPPTVPVLAPGALPGTPPPRPQSVPTTADLESIRRERDFFKQQMEYFRQQLNLQLARGPPPAAAPQPPPPGPVPPMAVPPPDSDRAPLRPQFTRGSSDASPRMEGDPSALRSEMRMYQQERDFYRQQYENLKATLAQPSAQAEEEMDITSVIRQRDFFQQERDFFRTQYNDISRRLAQITASPPTVSPTIRQEMESLLAEKRGANIARADLEAQVRVLTEKLADAEREKNEIDSHTRDLHAAIEKLQDAATSKFPPATQSFIMEIRKARDAAMSDLDRTKKERDQLKEKLRSTTAQQTRERASLEEESANLRRQTEEGSRQVADLTQRLHSQAALIASLQDQVVGLQEALQQAHDQLGLQGKQSDEMKKLIERKVGEVGDATQQLEFRLGQLGEAEGRARQLEGELERVRGELVQARTELATLRNSLTRLDHDKDLLNTEVDTRTQQLAELRDNLRKREAFIAQLEATIAKLEGKLEAAVAAVAAGERRIADEERRGGRLEQDLAAMIAARDNANKEIRRLQKEFASLEEAHKALREELAKLQASKDNFKRKAQEYCRTLEDLTHMMAAKDADQSALRKQYLSLNETVSSLKSLNASLEETVSTRQQEADNMEEIMNKFKEEREQLIGQIMEAGQQSDALEESSRRLEQEKYEAEHRLVAAQETINKLDARREQAETEIVRLNAALQKVMEEKRLLEQRVEATANQLVSERSSLRAAEESLTQKRRAEWSAEASIKQLEVEKNQIQRKLSEVQEQLEEESSELRRARTRAAQAEADVERIRRELTEERFERERTTQELRRVTRQRTVTQALDALTMPATTTPSTCSTTTTLAATYRTTATREGLGHLSAVSRDFTTSLSQTTTTTTPASSTSSATYTCAGDRPEHLSAVSRDFMTPLTTTTMHYAVSHHITMSRTRSQSPIQSTSATVGQLSRTTSPVPATYDTAQAHTRTEMRPSTTSTTATRSDSPLGTTYATSKILPRPESPLPTTSKSLDRSESPYDPSKPLYRPELPLPATPVTTHTTLTPTEQPSKPHASHHTSSSSDTGLERSQARSSSSDSHKEPWRVAFGSRRDVRESEDGGAASGGGVAGWLSASQESPQHSPVTFREVKRDTSPPGTVSPRLVSAATSSSSYSSLTPQQSTQAPYKALTSLSSTGSFTFQTPASPRQSTSLRSSQMSRISSEGSLVSRVRSTRDSVALEQARRTTSFSQISRTSFQSQAEHTSASAHQSLPQTLHSLESFRDLPGVRPKESKGKLGRLGASEGESDSSWG